MMAQDAGCAALFKVHQGLCKLGEASGTVMRHARSDSTVSARSIVDGKELHAGHCAGSLG
jgi:mevalonate pyrophosphate decarboxylase